MNRRSFCAGGTALAASALGWASEARAQRAAAPSRRVVLITLDGFAAENLNNPRIPLPNLRALAAEGAAADGMTTVTPSVTWPNHTTLVTGVTPAKHGVLANGVIERSAVGVPRVVNPRRTKDELTSFPTLFDAAHAVGMTTAEINWPVTRGSASLDVSFPDHPDPLRYTTPALLEELKLQGILPTQTEAAFSALGPLTRDYVWTQAAVRTIHRTRPHLLLLHLLLTDGVQHKHGPNNDEAYAALALADRCLGDVVEALRSAGLRGGTAVFVTADHGFARVERTISPNARLRRDGLIRAADGGGTEYDAWTIAEGGVALVYVPQAKLKPDLLTRTRRAVAALEGVDQVLDAEGYQSLGLPAPARNPQAPEFLLTARDGYAFNGADNGPDVTTLERPVGSHGYAATNPKMDAVFVAAGAGIRKGARLGRIRNVDVAPTIARLMGLTLTDVDGRPLERLLEEAR